MGRDANTVVDAGHRGTRDQGAARRSGSSLAALLAYLVLAVAVTWPLARHLDAALPLGTEPVATVPLFNLWTLWWNADRALHLGVDYWDAPIFFPAESAFAFSEAQPTTVVVAPLVWASETPAVAYNVYLLAALALNGLASFRLLRRLALGVPPAARLQTAMKAFPDARSLRLLRKRGARYAVVRRVVARREAIAGDAKLASRLHWVFGDDRAGLDVYAIE